MEAPIAGCLVGSAALHAVWNALVRGRRDPLRAMTTMSFASTALAVPILLLLPWPRAAALPFALASAALQVGYAFFLARAYGTGDLAQVYPVARGTAPALVTVAAALAAREMPSPRALVGIALVAAGAFVLANRTSSLRAPLATAAFIAAYTVVDGIGARISGSPIAYTACIFGLYGVALPLATWRGVAKNKPNSRDMAVSLVAGLLSALGYGVVVFAASHGPIGAVAALRETSVMFAAVIGRVFLGEPLPARRAVACASIALGAALAGPG